MFLAVWLLPADTSWQSKSLLHQTRINIYIWAINYPPNGQYMGNEPPGAEAITASEKREPKNSAGGLNELPTTHQVLRLSENGFDRVDRKAFMNLGTSLEQLDLSGNQLKLIEEETFRPLYGLQVLFCHHIAIICHIAEEMFRQLYGHLIFF